MSMGKSGRRVAWLLSRFMPESLRLRLRQRRYLAALRKASDSEPEMTVVRAIVQPGDFCVDIGANFGVYTAALSRMVGDSGHVVSIEPMAETYGLLSRNIQELGLGNVTTLQAAVTDTDGDVVMELPNWEYGGPNFYQAHITHGAASGSTHRVAGKRLDGILANKPGRVSFIKCDVEGHELAVLQGASDTLRDGPPWLIEVSGDPDERSSSAAAVIELLAASGYAVYRYTDGVLSPRQRGDQFINYFFLLPDHINRLRSAGLIRR